MSARRLRRAPFRNKEGKIPSRRDEDLHARDGREKQTYASPLYARDCESQGRTVERICRMTTFLSNEIKFSGTTTLTVYHSFRRRTVGVCQ